MDSPVVRCPRCGQANRIPPLSSGKRAACGKCGASLGAGKPVDVTDATFAATIAKGDAVVDFWATWCGPCRMIAPVIEELAASRDDLRFAKLNVDENQRTAAAYNARSIPLLVFFRDGNEVGRVVGAVPRAQIEAAIGRYFA